MKRLLGIGSVCLAAALLSPAAFAQTARRGSDVVTELQRKAAVAEAAETPHLGIGGQDVTADRAKALKLKEEAGIEVTSVEPDSAAAKAGLKQGDVVLEFNGQKVEGWEQLKRLVRETPIHREVKITVWRNGAEQTLTATMGEQRESPFDYLGSTGPFATVRGYGQVTPPNPPAAPAPPSAPMPSMPQFNMPGFFTWTAGTASLGIVGEALGQGSQLADFFGVKEGVLVQSVNKDSAAEKAGMKAGDVIVKIDDTNISTPQQISSVLRAARNKGSVTVTVVRNKKEMPLTVTPDANGTFRGGFWDPDNNILMQMFQPGRAQKIVWQ